MQNTTQITKDLITRTPQQTGGQLVSSTFVFYVVLWAIDCPFSLCFCIVCPYFIYGFWLPLWYLQAFLIAYIKCD